jgi:hypothetical protein
MRKAHFGHHMVELYNPTSMPLVLTLPTVSIRLKVFKLQDLQIALVRVPGLIKGACANMSIAFFLLFMGLLCLIFLIASVRTNIVFFGIFLGLVIAFGFLAGSFWHAGQGDAAMAHTLQVVSFQIIEASSLLTRSTGRRWLHLCRINAWLVPLPRSNLGLCRFSIVTSRW